MLKHSNAWTISSVLHHTCTARPSKHETFLAQDAHKFRIGLPKRETQQITVKWSLMKNFPELVNSSLKFFDFTIFSSKFKTEKKTRPIDKLGFNTVDQAKISWIAISQHVGSSATSITLYTTYPRRELTEEDLVKSLSDLGLAPSATLVVSLVSVDNQSLISNVIGWMRKSNRAARAARIWVHFVDTKRRRDFPINLWNYEVSISKFSIAKTTSLLSVIFTHDIKRYSNGIPVKWGIIVCVVCLNYND